MAVYDFSVGVFRSEYPAFEDEAKYPDTMITTAFRPLPVPRPIFTMTTRAYIHMTRRTIISENIY